MRDAGVILARALGRFHEPTGEGLGTPVIRGLSENRIRVLSDGVPLNHQQWSWRHSPNVETSLARSVEIVRGPASVLYGPDARCHGGVALVYHIWSRIMMVPARISNTFAKTYVPA